MEQAEIEIPQEEQAPILRVIEDTGPRGLLLTASDSLLSDLEMSPKNEAKKARLNILAGYFKALEAYKVFKIDELVPANPKIPMDMDQRVRRLDGIVKSKRDKMFVESGGFSRRIILETNKADAQFDEPRLVRDKVVDKLSQDRVVFTFSKIRPGNKEDFFIALLNKVDMETDALVASTSRDQTIEKLADILEASGALLDVCGVSMGQIKGVLQTRARGKLK